MSEAEQSEEEERPPDDPEVAPQGGELASGGAAPTPEAPDTSTTPTSRKDTKWDHTRRFLALLLIVAAGVGFFVARETDEFRSCETKVTRTSDAPPKVSSEQTCKALPPQDLLPFFLVALALLWADLTSIELFGLGRVAKRLNEQDGRQNALEASQQRLENRVETNVRTDQSVAITFANDENVARLAGKVVDLERIAAAGGLAPRPPDSRPLGSGTERDADATSEPAVEPEGHLSLFLAAFAPVQPWVEAARRLNQPRFAAAVGRAAQERPSADENLVTSDRELLSRIERGGTLKAYDLVQWAISNAFQIDAVRTTYSAGETATHESLRVATDFARDLWADLQRRGLVADE